MSVSRSHVVGSAAADSFLMQSPVVAEDEIGKDGDKTVTENVLELAMSATSTQTTRKAKVRSADGIDATM